MSLLLADAASIGGSGPIVDAFDPSPVSGHTVGSDGTNIRRLERFRERRIIAEGVLAVL